jgi:hypothetical protein
MVSANYYREQARIFLALAAAAKSAVTAERLRTRARDYTILAEALSEPPAKPPRAEPARPVAQQQQQAQPKKADE